MICRTLKLKDGVIKTIIQGSRSEIRMGELQAQRGKRFKLTGPAAFWGCKAHVFRRKYVFVRICGHS